MPRLDRYWQTVNPVALLLSPLALLFAAVAGLRRAAYRAGVLRVARFPVPVLVVGNITVGGTGKTPLVIWLARYLRGQGWQPGIVSRGYGGRARHWPQQVRPDSDPASVGDEAVMLERLRAVTAAQVQSVAQRYFGDERLTVVVLDPLPLAATARRPALPTRH